MADDRDYFLSRAAEEEAKAAESDNEAAQEAHSRLAEYYRRTAAHRGPRPLPKSA
ncbi:hypothetical protein [Sphingomonas hankyongi]|uniref:Uncharacterized protein n=1 Tax=Sphingomonas hankyongi TaxID=2908209 RepID=A0ABT0S102_9SPHN|nr:hypothetical protein [Sphingomonas hankyongi]MCL6729477.1 hypothetical protein [Sphingomonas hankyongi]